MGVLDVRTVKRLAGLICDRGGPYERSVRDLTTLLEGAGWRSEYQSGSRESWLTEVIEEHNDDRAAIEALLSRVVDPREYRGGLVDAEDVVGPLNEILYVDGFGVGHVGGRPFVRAIDQAGPSSLHAVADWMASPELRAKVRELVPHLPVADLLVQRLDEVDICRRHGAYLLAVIGTGAFAEGLLDEVLRPRDAETRKDKSTSLDGLLRRAYQLKWIQHDAHAFGGVVRQYRNLIHPREQRKTDATPDEDTVLMCWQPVLAMVNDLHRLVPKIPNPYRA